METKIKAVKSINVFVVFSQSKKHPTDWKIRLTFKDGYKSILPTDYDIISKSTRFGENPNREEMKEYVKFMVNAIAEGFGFIPVLTFID